mgnify:CR=1 FL=1
MELARSVLAEQGVVEVKCEFCNRGWRYDAVDIGALFSVTLPFWKADASEGDESEESMEKAPT